MATGQGLYGLARCLYEYPEVFEAFQAMVWDRRAEKPKKKESFLERRERTRQQRINRR